MNISDLAPPNATMTHADDPHRCWRCGYYSFKTYAGEDDTTGKCFRDHKKDRTVWFVDGLMTCPGWIEDKYGTYDPREVLSEDRG